MTPLDVAFPQQLAAPQESGGNYPMRPQQPNVQFGHMPHTDTMLRGSAPPPPEHNMQGPGPNVEHYERQAPQYDYGHPQQPIMQQHMQPPPQHMQQHPPPQQHMQQHPPPQQHMQQHPPQHQNQQQQRFQSGRSPTHVQQRLAQQTGPAPVAAEVITKTKSGML
jgi:hypothetical protein